ncbi:MAG: hypothetical protein ACPGXK_12020, partial [Phycisphaerae bacterium]
MGSPKYKRVVLKVSGEGLCQEGATGVDGEALLQLAQEIKKVVDAGVEVGLVVGGGNLIRGDTITKDSPIEQATGHYMGMLATVINAIAVQDTLESIGIPTRVQSAVGQLKEEVTAMELRIGVVGQTLLQVSEPALHHLSHACRR